VTLTTQNTFVQDFHSVPGCQTCMCKCGIRFGQNQNLAFPKTLRSPTAMNLPVLEQSHYDTIRALDMA